MGPLMASAILGSPHTVIFFHITQAMSTKTETEKYRRDRSKLTEDNKGNTMGAMYWQLNDVWQAPSWSSIEFGGKWKMLHYFAKKFFSPVLISPERTPSGIIRVFLISDLLQDVPNVRLNISIYSWDDFVPRKIQSSRVVLDKATSKNHKTFELLEFLEDSNCTKTTCFIYFSAEGPNIFTDNILYPGRLNEVTNMKKPSLTTTVTKTVNPTEVEIKVTTDKIAPFVWLETDEEGEFSDNGFMALKKEKYLIFRGRNKKPVNLDKLKSTLKIRSLL